MVCSLMEACKDILYRLLWQDFLSRLVHRAEKVSITRLFVLRVDRFCLPFSFNHLQGGRYHCVHSAVKRVLQTFWHATTRTNIGDTFFKISSGYSMVPLSCCHQVWPDCPFKVYYFSLFLTFRKKIFLCT